MALKDYYNTGDDSLVVPYGANNWWAQTFTASSSYTLNSIKLLVYRTSTPGTITVELRNATGDSPPKPGNTIHATDTFLGNSITTDSGGEWKETTFGTPYAVTSGTVYAIVVKAPSGDSSSPRLAWLYDDSASPGLAGANLVRTTNGGSSWDDFASHDAMFETYTGVEEYDEGTKTVTGSGIAFLVPLFVVGAGVISLVRESYASRVSWPNVRPSDYDEEVIYDEDAGAWITVDGSGGSRYQTQLVAIGSDDDGEGVVYFGST